MKELSSPPIAQGRTAEIYSWDSRHILKLYREWCPPDWVDYEARIARAVHESGVPSPEVGEIVEINGRRGLIYERLEGVSMLEDLNARPWTLLKQARSLAELQITTHQKSITGLPSYKDRLRYDIRETSQLTDELRKKAFSILDALPDGQNLCHGDYHPGNVFLTNHGPVIIDWMTACSGSPWADVARTSLLLTIGAKAAGKQVRPIVRTVINLYHRIYLNRYLARRENSGNELKLWTPVIAAARLSEDIIPEREALIKIVEEGFA
jgi:aminoglycoside phosphotransferase (APT) family kinase protein